MTNLNTIIMYPVENVLKNELRGSKGDLKRPFDRALRDYTDKGWKLLSCGHGQQLSQ